MMNLSKVGVCLVGIGLVLVGCNQKKPAQEVKSNGLPKLENTGHKQSLIAVIDIDSLATQYELCKIGLKSLETKQNSYRNQLNSKGQALQRAIANFQEKVQNGGFVSQQQAENAQAQLQKQQEALQNFQEKIEMEMFEATQKYQSELRDSLNRFIKEYNHDGRFKVILSKSGDNILYADPETNITDAVVIGLNKRYNKK